MDMLNLARCQRIIGSGWSSYTEAVPPHSKSFPNRFRAALSLTWRACPQVASQWGQGDGPIPLERAGIDFGPAVRPQVRCFCINPYQRRPGMNGYNCTTPGSWTSAAFCPLLQACVKPINDTWLSNDRPCAVWEKPCASCTLSWVVKRPGTLGNANGTSQRPVSRAEQRAGAARASILDRIRRIGW